MIMQEDKPYKENCSKKVKQEKYSKPIYPQLFFILISMASLMTLYEVIKQVISPEITIWQSHIITIIFSTVFATITAYFIFKKQYRLNNELINKKNQSECLEKELKNTIEELQTTLSKVKTLSGMLPICSSCKNIRNDEGYWTQIESYIMEYSEADFSHGICPSCAAEMYPDIYPDIDDE